jgi:hypothetical protein
MKRLARQSLEHSFLPGASLWADIQHFRPVTDCVGNSDASTVPATCQKFLDNNERARLQQQLEQEFARFERKF